MVILSSLPSDPRRPESPGWLLAKIRWTNLAEAGRVKANSLTFGVNHFIDKNAPIMIISFKDKKDEKDCCSGKRCDRRWGLHAKKIQQRLAEIAAAENLKIFWTLQHLHPHVLGGNRDGQISIDLNHPFRLLFVPDHDPVPRKENGELDMEKIIRVKIIEVAEDTHG